MADIDHEEVSEEAAPLGSNAAGAAASEEGTAASAVEDDGANGSRLPADLSERLAAMEKAVSDLKEFVPRQVRNLAAKVEGLTTSVSEPRCRALLGGILGVYDLVDQILRSLPQQGPTSPDFDHRRNYEVLRSQIRQLLETNGLTEIPTAGKFDPQLHCAIQQVPCVDPGAAGYVQEVLRPGFRTEHGILRYAEVTVTRYSPPPAVESAIDEGRA